MGLPKENDIQPKCLKTGPRGCFSRKAIAIKHATVYFNNVSLTREIPKNILVCFLFLGYIFLIILMRKLKKPINVSTSSGK